MLGLFGKRGLAAGSFRFSPSPLLTADTRVIGMNALAGLVEAAGQFGRRPEQALEGLAIERRQLENTRGTISWRELVRAIENLERSGMSLADLEHAGDYIARSQHLIFRPIANFFLRAEHVLYVGLRWVGPATFPVFHLELDYEGHELRLTLELADALPASTAYFHLCKGTLAATPTAIGQPHAFVSAAVSARKATFDIRCAPFERGAVRFGRIARALVSVPRVVETLSEQEQAIRRGFEAARDSESQFLRILGALPDAVVILKQDVIVYANPMLARVLGFERASELIGLCFDELLHVDGSREASERQHVRKDGAAVVLELSPRQAIEYEGSAAELLLARDVTEQRQLMSQLALADRMESLATIAAGIAHEINNPLALVIGNLELAERRGDDSREHVRAAAEGAARVRDIVQELRLFAQPDPVAPVAVDLSQVVESTLALARSKLATRATVSFVPSSVPPVAGSQGKLGQVLLNLLINASEAMPEGRPTAENRIQVRLSVRDESVRLEVEDNGTGIPLEAQAHVFAPFFSTRRQSGGSGLGLAVAHDIVQRAGGRIEFSSTPGKGTAFRIELPALVGRDDVPTPASGRRTNRIGRILVADDEPALRRTLELALGLGRHEVVTASSGNEAIACIERLGRFDLILCDLMMPDGSGPELFAHLSAHHPELARRMVFMTGGGYHDSTRRFLASVDNPRLEKPFRFEELGQLVERALSEG